MTKKEIEQTENIEQPENTKEVEDTSTEAEDKAYEKSDTKIGSKNASSEDNFNYTQALNFVLSIAELAPTTAKNHSAVREILQKTLNKISEK